MINLDDVSYIDLTHTLSLDIPHWGGSCGFENKIVTDYGNCKSGVKFRVQHFNMVAGIGTHMDAPAHCIEGGSTISDIPLKSLISPCCVINIANAADEKYCLTVDDIKAFETQYGTIQQGVFVIIYTGWDRWWNQPEKYRNNHIFPSVSKQAAEMLLERGIVGLGIDTLSPDTADSQFPVHQVMLSAGKYIIENVANAAQLNATGDYIIALPINIFGATEAPIRLVGLKHK